MKRVANFKLVVLPFLMGMTASLYLYIPALGVIPMFDLFSYVISIFIICTQWSRMGKHMRRTIILCFAWTLSAVISNTLNFIDFKYTIKCVAVASSSWALTATAYLFLKDDARQFVWYLVGAGIGGWVSLYHFQNGAYLSAVVRTGLSATDALIDKQRFPYIARGIFLGCSLPFFIIWKKFPNVLAIVACVLAAFYLLIHGGSRSYFGIFLVSAMAGFGAMYMKRIMRSVIKSKTLLIFLSMIVIVAVFSIYKTMAKSGGMEEGEEEKFENEFGEGSESGLGARTGYQIAMTQIWLHPLGAGGNLRCHSVIMNTLACDGPIGFFFWVFFYMQVLWFVCNRLGYMGRWTVFFMVNLVCACWDCLGSPFGARHEYFVLLAFIALCRDRQLYGYGSIFENIPYRLQRPQLKF